MVRKAIAVNDDGGFYSIIGRRPVSWATFEQDLEHSYAYEQGVQVDYEPLQGWDGWSYGILVNGTCVGFVDGSEPPSTVMGVALAR